MATNQMISSDQDEIKAANKIVIYCLTKCLTLDQLFPTSSSDSSALVAANILRNLTCNNQYFKDEVAPAGGDKQQPGTSSGVSMTSILSQTFNLLVTKYETMDGDDIKIAANFYELGEAILSTLKNLTSKSLSARNGKNSIYT